MTDQEIARRRAQWNQAQRLIDDGYCDSYADLVAAMMIYGRISDNDRTLSAVKKAREVVDDDDDGGEKVVQFTAYKAR